MSSALTRQLRHTAAWRISFWGSLVYALGLLLVFVSLHIYVAHELEHRDDIWLVGELTVQGDMAERTPRDALDQRAVEEVAELASHEIPNHVPDEGTSEDAVFFLETDPSGQPLVWVGPGQGEPFLDKLRHLAPRDEVPFTLTAQGFPLPYRVTMTHIDGGNVLYLGLSDRDRLRVLRAFRLRCAALWGLLVLFGFGIVFATTWRMLQRVRSISEAAAQIDHSDLSARVPASTRKDEIGHLARTLNRMLDRIQVAMHQLHTITGALAHDLRSPLTAVRGNLERALTAREDLDRQEAIVVCMEELDRLVDFLNTALDVAEAKADALRLNREAIDLDQMLHSIVDLYEPSMAEHGLHVEWTCAEPVQIAGDRSLLHRVFANVLNNEIVHLPAGRTVQMRLWREAQWVYFRLDDDGPGFSPEILGRIFTGRVKGAGSKGYGLGLAFVDAVARAHGGSVHAANKTTGGASLLLVLPAAAAAQMPQAC